MYIEPNSTIILCSGIRLDTTYTNTIYFANATDQYNYFYGKRKHVFTQNYYQRVERGYFKADINAEELYDVSYMMFQNTAFGNRWFYAFVTSAEYINNRVTRIGFEIDVMQTWMFDYNLLECWVEREHIANDTIGNNIVPENLNIGDYMISSRSSGYTSNGELTLTPCVCIATTVDWTKQEGSEHGTTFDYSESVQGTMYGRIYSGVKYKIFHLSIENNEYKFYNREPVAGITSTIEINDWLEGITSDNKVDGIVSIFMFYEELVSLTQPYLQYHLDLTTQTNYNEAFGSYTPKNRKLYTYPYNVLSVTDNRGTMATYKMEYWRGNPPKFALFAGLSADPSLMLVPLNYNYKDVSQMLDEFNYDEKIVAKGFPPCSFNIDAFKAYVAQNGGVLGMGATIGLSMAESLCQFGSVNESNLGEKAVALNNQHQITQGIPSTQGAQLTRGVASIVQSVRDLYIASTKPNQFGGNANGDVIFTAGQQKFSFEIKHIRPEFARIIDNYFDMYGYATKEIKIPNTHSRPHWNYVQTKGCAIESDLNISDTTAITSIYNKGITFWKNGDKIGDYSLDNRAW